MPIPTTLQITDARGRPVAGPVTVYVGRQVLSQGVAGDDGSVTVDLPDSPTTSVTVMTRAQTLTAPAGQIAGLLGPTPMTRAGARLAELRTLAAGNAGLAKVVEVLTELLDAVRH